MKSFRMLMMAALTILAISVYAQNEKTTKSSAKQPGNLKYTCPVHPGIIQGKAGHCPNAPLDFTKSKKEEMKMTVTKVNRCQPAEGSGIMALNLSAKEQMKRELSNLRTGTQYAGVAGRYVKLPVYPALMQYTPKEEMKVKVMKMPVDQ